MLRVETISTTFSFNATCSAVNSGSSQVISSPQRSCECKWLDRVADYLTAKTSASEVSRARATSPPTPRASSSARPFGGFDRRRSALSRGARCAWHGVSRSVLRPPGSRPRTLELVAPLPSTVSELRLRYRRVSGCPPWYSVDLRNPQLGYQP